jgi:hypothetical protein
LLHDPASLTTSTWSGLLLPVVQVVGHAIIAIVRRF